MPSQGRQNAAAYSAVLTTVGFAELSENFLRVHDLLEADGEVALASLLRKAYLRLKADVEQTARAVAAKATEYIKEEEATSRVRPDTEGHGGARLEDFVGESFPLVDVPGSVGINYEPALYDNVPWWWTNEEGYSGHVGRVVHGFFYEAGFDGPSGRAVPSPDQFREHPLFRAEGPQRDTNPFGPSHDRQPPAKSGKGVRPGMRIENPILPREFVRRGSQRAEADWHGEIQKAKSRWDTALDRILAAMRLPVAP